MRRGKTTLFTFVFAGGRPSSYFLFLWYGLRLPPVLRRLCQLSLEIPEQIKLSNQVLDQWTTHKMTTKK
uniref:Uncharacterized protein n=1 Tax=Monopterus albus TaxID=43700 RepID=A0A3Q3QVS8_MONAL